MSEDLGMGQAGNYLRCYFCGTWLDHSYVKMADSLNELLAPLYEELVTAAHTEIAQPKSELTPLWRRTWRWNPGWKVEDETTFLTLRNVSYVFH